ncbi:MAG TPA: glycosyltransferase family 4 protein [Candidatus Acidoferrales bacterium]|jgi:glycosyltransferase involved in cell wall biosynthesis|nr:glycosyltransferase family 4 protein [Candidatus Acidoferrales bacterium]
MKVLIYTHGFAPQIGGTETHVMLLAQGLAEFAAAPGKAIDVTVATRTPAGAAEDAALHFRVVRRPSLAALLRLIREADIVHLAGPAFLTLLLGLLMRKRVTLEHHSFQVACPNGLLVYEPTATPCPGHFMARRHGECLRCNAKEGKVQSLKMWLSTFPRRWMAKKVAANIMPTDWLETILEMPKAVTIHHGLALGLALGTGDIATTGSAGAPAFAFVGRLVPSKGTEVLLRAGAQLKRMGRDFRLKIVGDGPARGGLEALARELGLDDLASFVGFLSTEEREESLAGATTVVMPSLGGEVFGLVAAENMAHGRLLIVSDIGALQEVIGDTGLSFPIGDAEALAGCMKQVLDDPEIIRRLGAAARERAQKLFRLEKMVEQHVLVYERLMNPAGGGRAE